MTDDSASFKTQTGAPMGTPYYMSPEQCRGRDVDHRTDIYAFGCMTYKMLTDRVPFDGADHLEILMKQIGETAAPPSSVRSALGPGIDEVVAWLMSKSVDDRPATLTQAIAELEKVVADAAHQVDRSAIPGQSATTGASGRKSSGLSASLGSLPTMATPKSQLAESVPATTDTMHAPALHPRSWSIALNTTVPSPLLLLWSSP